jgi:hypothetical protein
MKCTHIMKSSFNLFDKHSSPFIHAFTAWPVCLKLTYQASLMNENNEVKTLLILDTDCWGGILFSLH